MSKHFIEPLNFQEIKKRTDQFILGTYRRAPVAFYFGQGDTLFDTENKSYIDFLSGIAVTSLGHGEADIVEAIREQAERLLHTSNLFYNQEQALLAEALIGYSFKGKVFFCNSGTEANEAAFKLVRRHAELHGKGHSILTLTGSFHGRTAATMSLTGQDKIHNGFGPLISDVKYIPPEDIELLEKELDESGSSICAMMIELVQGEGGVRPLSREYVKAVRELTQKNNILLVIDEIQTGIGRTGKLFAYEHYGIKPDAMTLAKALANGIPIGAMVVAERYTNLLEAGMHGSTFGGNHLAARVAYETLRIIVGREILVHAAGVSEYLFRRLRLMQQELPSLIKDVRGLGLLIGVELERTGAVVVDRCRESGLLINCTSEKTLRLLPPLNVSLERAQEAMDILEKVLKEIYTSVPAV